VEFTASPNPFSGSTTLCLGRAEATPMSLQVFSVDGRLVRTMKARGSLVLWPGDDDNGRRLGPGIYWCRLTSARGRSSLQVVKAD
jgi:hypothetical protein